MEEEKIKKLISKRYPYAESFWINNKDWILNLIYETQKEVLQETYDYLYDNLPVVKLDAFDLVKTRKRELDCISKQIETLSLNIKS